MVPVVNLMVVMVGMVVIIDIIVMFDIGVSMTRIIMIGRLRRIRM